MKSKKQTEKYLITSEFIEEVSQRISENKRVRRKLPLNGRLHIDRSLPFLCVYRRPASGPDQGTERFVQGEASYLIASSSRRIKSSISQLVGHIVRVLENDYGAVLILEIWSDLKTSETNSSDPDLLLRPYFQIRMSSAKFPTQTIESLEKALKRVTILKHKARVKINLNAKPWPAEVSSILSATDIKNQNVFLLGLEISAIYRNPETHEIYPFVLRKLHQGISRAIKLGLFAFSHHNTTHRPPTYQALGRRAVVKAVWTVDKNLAQISNMYDFLLNITPINIEQAWNQFKKYRFERSPVFYYRPIPVDPSSLKKQLYQIPIDDIEDPTLSFLFREKQIEIERELSMLRDRGTRNFFYTSLQLFGSVNNDLIDLASQILTKIAPHRHESHGQSRINAEQFSRYALQEIEFFRQTLPDLSSRVEIRDDISGLMVSRGNLLIGKQLSVPSTRVEALIQHEMGTHMLTYLNGRSQPLHQLYTGLAGYDELQEGLAVLAEYLVGGLSLPRLRLLAARVFASNIMIKGASFIETFRSLCDSYGFAQRTAYIITARIFRSGGLTKDAVYLRGLERILKYLSNGGTIDPLLVGKISAWHIPIIKELESRQILKPAPLHPRYLENAEAKKRLESLKKGISVLNLIKSEVL
jgi:uncharacterized protein (TIGR02421 family)